MRKSILYTLAAALLLSTVPAAADTEVEGTTAGGAHYKIVVPDSWNGGLVIWNHGFDLGPIGPVSDIGLLAELQLAEGFAVAASSYRQRGWAVFKSTQDLRLMVQAFTVEFGAPDQVIVTGGSLGGAVTAAALEQGGIGNVTGAVSVCGAVAGSRNWDGALDLRLLYDQICAGIPEAAIPGGAKGLPKNSTLLPEDIAAAVNACMGVDLKKRERSAQQKANLKRFRKITGLPKDFVQTVMGYATFALADLTYDRGKMRGKVGIGNENVDYGNATVNAEIARVAGGEKATNRLAKNFTPSGDVGDVKIVSIHTNKDGLVIVENQNAWAAVVPPENLTVAIVKEKKPTHCGFSISEGIAAWESLLEWLATGVQPTAADIQANCRELAPLFGGSCRYSPGFVVKSMDKRVRPRNPGAGD